MTELKGGLGRGLSALLPHEVRIAGSPQLRDIAIDEIKPNARQPRTVHLAQGEVDRLRGILKRNLIFCKTALECDARTPVLCSHGRTIRC